MLASMMKIVLQTTPNYQAIPICLGESALFIVTSASSSSACQGFKYFYRGCCSRPNFEEAFGYLVETYCKKGKEGSWQEYGTIHNVLYHDFE
jgi:hypothetical protein